MIARSRRTAQREKDRAKLALIRAANAAKQGAAADTAKPAAVAAE